MRFRDLYGYEYKIDGTRIMIEPQTLANAGVSSELHCGSAQRFVRYASDVRFIGVFE
jgi:hypothetical protein